MDRENDFRQTVTRFPSHSLNTLYTLSKSALDVICCLNLARGISYFNMFETAESPTANRIKETINNLEIFPCLNMITYKHSTLVYDQKDCPCQDVFKYSYSLLIRQRLIKNYIIISGIFVPFSPTIKINTCTFFWRSESSRVMYCPEIRSMISPTDELPITIKDYIKSFLNDDNIKKSCMILLGKTQYSSVLKNFVSSLTEWFPDSKIPIWGGIVSEIVVCNTVNNEHFCRVPVNLTCFFMSSETLEAWSIIWPKKNQTEELIKQKLINFKQGLNLKNYSLGLIFLSRPYCSNNPLELRIFKDVFPGMPYYFAISDLAFAGEKIKDIKNIIFGRKSQGKDRSSGATNEETAVMIITYE